MKNLDAIADAVRADFEATNVQREAALACSRSLIRRCSEMIKAIHRLQWDLVEERQTIMLSAVEELRAAVKDHPQLEYSGYTQDALKEYVEAELTYAIVRGAEEFPTPEDLVVGSSAYLNGMAEAASEIRRYILDRLRNDKAEDVEQLLDVMDTIYATLFSFDFPDAITGGLRRHVDQLRAVLERTRGDVTASVREQRLMAAMREFEGRLGVEE
jgi:translin